MKEENRSRFIRVRCKDCSYEQVIFDHASTRVECLACGGTIAEPRGGKVEIRAEVISVADEKE
jgi:small subunit ribosomal protein S27e